MLEAVKDVDFTIIELESHIERIKKSVIKLSNRYQDTLSKEYPFSEEVSLLKAQVLIDSINGLYKEAIRIEEISDSLKSKLEELMRI